MKTTEHTYLLWCNLNSGDYNFCLYAYVSRHLDHHMEQAQRGIRFITPGYKELFRIPDGDKVRICMMLSMDKPENEITDDVSNEVNLEPVRTSAVQER